MEHPFLELLGVTDYQYIVTLNTGGASPTNGSLVAHGELVVAGGRSAVTEPAAMSGDGRPAEVGDEEEEERGEDVLGGVQTSRALVEQHAR
ncbi:hypothetical protein ACIBP6_40825 [Nonomuraea terrae]|uniref:hypothetical protein n=1 Tax=Nonomuraea terrae TaxID=2530383 RepID=UPI0037B264A3